MRSHSKKLALLAVVALLFGVVTLIRYAFGSVGEGYTLLYVLPVALAALQFRLAGGLCAAALAVVFVFVWAHVDDADFTVAGYLTRAMTFFVLGGLVGFETQQLRRAHEERERLLIRLETMAHTDQLTGLANRRAWDEALQREIERAGRGGDALVVALLDLDRFKDYNDRHGHPAGDALLRQAAAAWVSELRVVDTLARYGGEEFAVLLSGCRPDYAVDVVERLRALTPLGQSVSAGMANWDGEESGRALVERADKALYEAKRNGRDRSVVAGPA